MICNDIDMEANPTEFELKIYHEVRQQFKLISSANAQIYKAFESSTDPVVREKLAKKIQSIEENIIHNIAREFNLSFDKVARIYFKVDTFKNN